MMRQTPQLIGIPGSVNFSGLELKQIKSVNDFYFLSFSYGLGKGIFVKTLKHEEFFEYLCSTQCLQIIQNPITRRIFLFVKLAYNDVLYIRHYPFV